MSEYSLSTTYKTVNYPWSNQDSIWDRQAVIKEGSNQYLLIKLAFGGLNNAVPSPLLAYKLDASSITDVTSSLFDQTPMFAITRELIVADLNGDGYDDIFLCNQGPEPSSGLFPGEQSAIYIYQPSTQKFKQTYLSENAFGHGGTVGDFNGDGLLDIFLNTLGSVTGVRSFVLLQGANASFSQYAIAQSLIDNVGPLCTALDVNRDKKYELASIDQNGSLVIWTDILSSAPKLLTTPTVLPTTAKGIFEIRAADFDGNGTTDILAVGTDDAIQNSNGVTLGGYLKAGLVLDAGLPTQRIVEPLKNAGINLLSTGGVRLELADLNNSGTVDFELRAYDVNWGWHRLTVTVNSDGSTTTVENSGNTKAINAAYIDVNQDSVLDLVSDQYGSIRIQTGLLADISLPPGNLTGTMANDEFHLSTGKYIVDGGAGYDSAIFELPNSNFRLYLASTEVTIESLNKSSVFYFQNVEKLQFSDRSVIIESKSHGSYADLPTELYQFFITAFDAAPGVTYMDQLADAYRWFQTSEPNPVKKIVDIFTTKTQFTDVYSQSLSHAELATQLVNNIVKNSATASAKSEAIADIKGALDIGWSVGDVIYTVFGNLAHKPLTDLNWGNTAKQFNNEIAVAKYYTEVLNQSTTDLETLRDVIQPVTQSTDVSTDTVIAQLIGVALISGGTIP